MKNMKKLYYILAGAAMLASLAACDHSAKYQTNAFARLTADSYSIKEDGGTLRIPVSVFNNDGNSTNVTFVVEDLTTAEGSFYTVEPSNGVLSFTGNGTQYITLNIVNRADEYTGNYALDVTIKNATNDVDISGMTSARVVIEDNDHPLNAILGTYTLAGKADYWGDVYDFSVTIAPDPDDITKVIIQNLDPYFVSYGYTAARGYNQFSGQVNDEKTQIVAPKNQLVGYQDVFLFGSDAANFDDASGLTDLVIEIGPNTITFPYAWGLRSASGYWCLYNGPMTLTK